MAYPPSRRWWKFWTWFADWAWWERTLLAILTLAPLLTLAYGGRSQSGEAGILAGLWFVTLQAIVYRHGGWGILGPHFYYDVVRLARRGRSTGLRVAYILAMFVGLTVVYETSSLTEARHPNDFARVSERFAYALFVVQNLAIFVLIPAYLGSAITEEKERRSLELLFTTQLTNKEIIFGKLFSRIVHLFGFVLAGFPILSLIQFWGGIDILVIAGNLANTMLNILTLGSFCLLVSVPFRTVSGSVMMCYVVLLPPSFCCLATTSGFPFVLQDARWGGTGHVTIQDLGILLIAHSSATTTFLTLAIWTLRGAEPFAGAAVLSPVRRYPLAIEPGTDVPTSSATRAEVSEYAPTLVEEPLDDLSIPYALPPITDDALWWKERYVGGPSFIMSPIVLVPAIPFLAAGMVVTTVLAVHAVASPRDAFVLSMEWWANVARFFFYAFLGCYVLGVAYRATAAIARERQQQTLEPLLLLPIERIELLRVKWLSCVWRGWPWLAMLTGNLVLGTVFGVYHPVSAVLLALATLPLIAFFASLGLLLSIVMATVMRANLIMVIVLVLYFACMTSALFGESWLAYLETLTFSWWSPDREWQRLLVALSIWMTLVLAAYVSWRISVRCFEDRSKPAE